LNKKSKSDSYSYEITTVISKLKDDIIKLCKSLGFKVSVSTRKAKTFDYKDKIINGKEAYRISISGKIGIIPCQIKRKKPPVDWVKKSPSNFTSIKVEKSDINEYFGITLQQEGNGELQELYQNVSAINNKQSKIEIHFRNIFNSKKYNDNIELQNYKIF
jgi:hypothetical protein